jgi:hypothetical protein
MVAGELSGEANDRRRELAEVWRKGRKMFRTVTWYMAQ